MALAHFRMLIHELLNKDPDIVPEEAPLIIWKIHFVSNGEKCKIDWCEGVLQLASIATNNIGDHYLTPRMKYIVVRLHK